MVIYNYNYINSITNRMEEQEPIVKKDTRLKIKACPKCHKPIYFKRMGGKYKCYGCGDLINEVDVEVRVKKNSWSGTGKKRILTDDDIITRNELLSKISIMKGDKRLMKQALVSFLYLTAARVEEVVGMINHKLSTKGKRVYTVEPVKKNQLSFKELDDEDYLVIERMPVLKRRTKDGRPPRRNVPIYVNNDKEFIEYIQRYIQDKDREGILFNMTYQRAWQISNEIILDNFKKDKGFNHYWRHLRLTHLAEDYGFQDLDLQQYVGWANTLMASKYTHLNWQALAMKMRRVKIK